MVTSAFGSHRGNASFREASRCAETEAPVTVVLTRCPQMATARSYSRELSALNESKAIDVEQEKRKEGEGDMASGVTRGDQGRKSNISPSSQRSNKSKSTKKVKNSKARGKRTNGGKEKAIGYDENSLTFLKQSPTTRFGKL